MSQGNEWKHPELRKGEVYIGNFDTEGIGFGNKHFRYSFPSERLGVVAYYCDGPDKGTPIPPESGLRPWFALRTEVEASGMQIAGR